jgi:hypothetical protein
MKLHFSSNGSAYGWCDDYTIWDWKAWFDFFIIEPRNAGTFQRICRRLWPDRIRCEAAIYIDSESNRQRHFYTFRAFARHYLGVPAYLWRTRTRATRVYALQTFAAVALALCLIFNYEPSHRVIFAGIGAIAVGTTADGSHNTNASLTYTFTSTGTNRIFFNGAWNNSLNAGRTFSSPTYDSVAMNQTIGNSNFTGAGGYSDVMHIIGQNTTSSAVVSITQSSAGFNGHYGVSYSGVAQTSPIGTVVKQNTGTATTESVVVSASNTNSWALAFTNENGNTGLPLAGSGTTARITTTVPTSNATMNGGFFDSNAAMGASTYTLNFSESGANWKWVVIAFALAPVGTTFNQSLSVTATAVVSLTKALIRVKSLAVTATAVLSLSRIKTAVRSLTVTATSVISLTKIMTALRSLSVTATAVPSVVKVLIRVKSLVVTATSVPSLVKALIRVKSLAVTATSVPSLLKNLVRVKTLSVTAAAVLSLSKVMTALRSLTVTTTAVVTLSKITTAIRSLSVTATAVPSLTKIKTALRSLTVTATAAVSLAKVRIVVKTLAVIASAAVTLSKVMTALRSLTVTATGTVSLSRIASYFRTLSVTSSASATLSRVAIYVRTLSVTATATIAIQKTIQKILTVTAYAVRSMVKTVTYFRTLSIIATAIPGLSYILKLIDRISPRSAFRASATTDLHGSSKATTPHGAPKNDRPTLRQ